jgi:hypothetical protein
MRMPINKGDPSIGAWLTQLITWFWPPAANEAARGGWSA